MSDRRIGERHARLSL